MNRRNQKSFRQGPRERRIGNWIMGQWCPYIMWIAFIGITVWCGSDFLAYPWWSIMNWGSVSKRYPRGWEGILWWLPVEICLISWKRKGLMAIRRKDRNMTAVSCMLWEREISVSFWIFRKICATRQGNAGTVPWLWWQERLTGQRWLPVGFLMRGRSESVMEFVNIWHRGRMKSGILRSCTRQRNGNGLPGRSVSKMLMLPWPAGQSRDISVPGRCLPCRKDCRRKCTGRPVSLFRSKRTAVCEDVSGRFRRERVLLQGRLSIMRSAPAPVIPDFSQWSRRS